MNLDGEALLKSLARVRGRLEPNAPLADFTWFRVGGPAEVLFTPADEADLAEFVHWGGPSMRTAITRTYSSVPAIFRRFLSRRSGDVER